MPGTGPARIVTLGLTGGAVASAAALLPLVPAPVAALICVALGALAALPDAAAAAVRAGHRLAVWAPGGVVRRLTGGGAVRVAVFGIWGTVLAAVLLVRLAAGGPAVWALAAAAAALTLALVPLADRALRSEVRGAHRAGMVRMLARAGAVAGVVALSLVLARAGASPESAALPAALPAARSALVAEALVLSALAAGAEAWLAGRAVAVGLLPPGWEAALALAAQAAVGWAAGTLALAASMPAGAWRRALGPATDAAEGPGATPAALAAAALLALAVPLAAARAEGALAAVPADRRPVAQVQVAAERIGDALYPPGTAAAIRDGRQAVAVADDAARVRLRAALATGFDAMEARVDPFLDAYYSLGAEYLRLGHWIAGDLAGHLERSMTAALTDGAPLAAFDAARSEAARLAAEAAAAAGREAALLARPLPAVNPGRVALTGAHPAPPAFPVPAAPGMVTSAGERLALSAVAGGLGAAVAGRIAARLAARGALGLAAKALGTLAAVGVDYALLKGEEALHRAAFRAEIVAAIRAERAAALAALE